MPPFRLPLSPRYAFIFPESVVNKPTCSWQTLGSQYTGEPTTAVEQFKHDASETTNKAVEEGKDSVEAAKALGAGYVDQAKAFATSAIETVQVRHANLGLLDSC